MSVNHKIMELLGEWSGFTAEREAERHRLQNPPGVSDLKAQMVELNRQMAELKSQQHVLKAKITMASQVEPYNKATFDVEWAEKKKNLKELLEQHLMAEISGGKSIPTIMNEYELRNPVWLYQIKERLTQHQKTAASKVANAIWYWSHYTGTHRYALAKGDTGKWAFVKMFGSFDTELEGEEAIWDYNTGEFLVGSPDVFNSDTPSGRTKRSRTLASVLEGSYTGAYRESPNPYQQGDAAA